MKRPLFLFGTGGAFAQKNTREKPRQNLEKSIDKEKKL